MKTGIEIQAFIPEPMDMEGFARGAERMKSFGYDCTDYQFLIDTENSLFRLPEAEMMRAVREHRKLLDAAGILPSQTHGPWRYPPRDLTEEDRAERFAAMSKAIRATAELGCPYMAIHNVMPFGKEDTDEKAAVEINFEYYGKLARVAEENGVVICLENMPFLKQYLAAPARTLEFVKSLNSNSVRMCLDTGHAIVHGVSPADAVRMIGKEYLRILHVHDNNGLRDLHWIPYTGAIDWDDFSAALREIGFEGSVSLETSISGDVPENEVEARNLALARNVRRIAGLL